ncbi:NQO1 dehydrogenase, partial [Polypterus senegalus]
MVSDLYELKFNPTATKNDIKGEVKNPDNFSYGDETGLAWKEGKLSNDIMEEQKKIKAADLIVFQFPLYWYSVPAILKGWFDRVLTQGFAYTFETLHDNGPFKYGVLHFCGFQVLPPQISWTPKLSSPEARAAMLNSWRIRLDGIWTEKPLSFVPINSFDLTLNGGFMLKEEVVKSQEGNSNGLTVGQHMGKCIPPNNQTGQTLSSSTRLRLSEWSEAAPFMAHPDVLQVLPDDFLAAPPGVVIVLQSLAREPTRLPLVASTDPHRDELPSSVSVALKESF